MRSINHSYRVALFSGIFDSTRMLIGAIQALYLLSTGVSLGDLAFLKAYFALLILIFDIPFGMLGDFISNKVCVYFSCACISCYYIFSLFSPDFVFLIAAESFYAIGLCLISGSLESLLVQSVKKEYENADTKISYFYFLSNEIMSIGSMISAPLGVVIFLAHGDIRSVYFLASIFMFLLPLLIYRVDEMSIRQSQELTSLNGPYFKSILTNAHNWMYVFVASLIMMAYQPIYHFWQPLFIQFFNGNTSMLIVKNNEQNTAVMLGVVFFVYSLSNYIFNKYAKNKLSKNSSIELITLISFLLLALILSIVFVHEKLWLLIILFSAVHGFMSIFSSLTKSVLIAEINQQQMATVISFSNVVGRVFISAILFICSLFISNGSLRYVFLLTFISIMLALFIYLRRYVMKGEKNVSLSVN